MGQARRQMPERQQPLFTVHLILQLLTGTLIPAIPEECQERCQQDRRQGEQNSEHIAPLLRLGHCQFAGVESDKDGLLC